MLSEVYITETLSITERLKQLQPEENPLYPQNDIGVSRLFFDLHREVLCYVPEARAWYVYSGNRWVKDDGGLRVMELCKTFTQELHEYAKPLGIGGAFEKFAASLHGRKRRESILRDACSVSPRSLSRFDRDRHLFNCQNGTFNLVEMKLQPHSPGDYLTKLSGAEYHPNACCGRWDSFILEVMQGDAETARFLQKALGYCLSGDKIGRAHV